ncbi:MAG: tetratricopeptide repeat protein [Pyrinomonadaceae bacterium]
MFADLRSKHVLFCGLILLVIALCFQVAAAQTDDPTNGETDPVKLFEKGQDAHARNDYKLAIQLYDAAIKLKPEFPEAEFQRAMALLMTNRKTEAIEGFNRAVSERPDWPLPYAKFGSLLAFPGNADTEAEPLLRKAIQLDDKNSEAIVALAVLKQRAGNFTEAVKLMTAATGLSDATFQTWRRRAYIESAAGASIAAVASISHAIEMKPQGMAPLYLDRARLRLQMNDRAGALLDLDYFRPTISAGTHYTIVLDVAQLYARAGNPDESLKLLDSLSESDRKLPEVVTLRGELAGNSGSSAEERAALEDLLQRNPQDANILSRLGNAYRRIDPIKSQGYYHRALQLDPKNPHYATGYAAALIQGRQFAEAEPILKGVIKSAPDDYTAHANLALALYEMKRFDESLREYEWLASARPEIAATYFFIATAHDNLGEYKQALDSYESFLSRADPTSNKLEIEKVNLRMPVLRAQIQRGQGAKQKRPR